MVYSAIAILMTPGYTSTQKQSLHSKLPPRNQKLDEPQIPHTEQQKNLKLMDVSLKKQLQRVGDFFLHMDGCFLSLSLEFRNLSVILGSNLSNQSHIKYIT